MNGREREFHGARGVRNDPFDRVGLFEYAVYVRPRDARLFCELEEGGRLRLEEGGREGAVGGSGLEVVGDWGGIAVCDGNEASGGEWKGSWAFRSFKNSAQIFVAPNWPVGVCHQMQRFLSQE